MVIFRRTNQGGSVASFAVIGIILICGLIASVYILKNHGEQVRKDQAIAAYEKQKSEKQSDGAKKQTGSSESAAAEDSDKSSESVSYSGSTQDLPTTGPGMKVSEMLGACLLSVSLVGYMTSRRNNSIPL